ncbi:CAMK family protein kinase [Metarhizium acridum CQMa 102]|uniref:CAMK family protein kinase n=1 Tax=Metarhizium acridum (strain CQMa 102) TaxID=655827 RepID=E9EFD3_METAQ|nr:CAMK family protein kinase [Metarhizium acridum CQMa 102]EFY85386.1 CAMK family protein kinase [Metarhizium acridum CQMa 102]
MHFTPNDESHVAALSLEELQDCQHDWTGFRLNPSSDNKPWTSKTSLLSLSDEPPKKFQYGRDDRETTEPTQEEDAKVSAYDGRPFIEIRFSKIPRSSHGVIFGCNRKSDVVLPNLRGLSHFHFSLTFDERRRFIVKDLGSLMGTEVTYDNKGKGKRRNFNWIISGDRKALQEQNIIINIHENVKFEIVAINHNITSPSYIDNVEKFCQGSVTAEGLLDDLNIPLRPDTEFATEAHTPGEGPICLKKKIGEGAFGVVIHCWDVSTGDENVIKRPTDATIRKFLRTGANKEAKLDKDRKKWKAEAENMKNLIHLFDVIDDPYPQLVLEYIPGGPLSQLENITISESMLVLTQCLSALTLIHENGLAHRDISPNNILVKSREPLVVVLADFGLSKDAEQLLSKCGTAPFAAPDIFEDRSFARYSAVVDIWSLGVVMCRILGILPSYSMHMISDVLWREATVVYASDTDTDEQTTVRPRDAAPAITAGEANDDERSTDGMSSRNSSSGGGSTRQRIAAAPPPSRQSEARSSLKRPTAEMASQNPKLKRRGRASISQSDSFLDTEVGPEAVEAAAVLQMLEDARAQSAVARYCLVKYSSSPTVIPGQAI